MDYGVGVQNRYAFLEDDAEDLEDANKLSEISLKDKKLGKKPEASSSVQAKDKVKPKTTTSGGKPPIPTTSSVKPGFGRETEPSSRGRGGVSGRGRGTGARSMQDRNKENFDEESSSRGSFSSRGGGRGRGRGGSGTSGGRQIRESNQDFDEWGTEPAEDVKPGVPEASSRGRGSSRGGGSGPGRGGFTRRRDFDRQSGSDRSGIKPVDKREGGGARNWGSYKDEIDGEPETRTGEDKETVEIEVTENGQGDAGAGMHGVIRQKPEGMQDGEAEEPKLMTLGEWKASIQPRETPTFNIRKPNEGTDPSQWKNLILKKKEKEDDDEYYEEGLWIPQRAGRQKRITDIGFHFQDDGDREARRGFRAPRGGRRNFENRQEENRNREPNPPRVDDVNDFPSLGGVPCIY